MLAKFQFQPLLSQLTFIDIDLNRELLPWNVFVHLSAYLTYIVKYRAYHNMWDTLRRWTGDTKTMKEVHTYKLCTLFDRVPELQPFLYSSNSQLLAFIGSARNGHRRPECNPAVWCSVSKKNIKNVAKIWQSTVIWHQVAVFPIGHLNNLLLKKFTLNWAVNFPLRKASPIANRYTSSLLESVMLSSFVIVNYWNTKMAPTTERGQIGQMFVRFFFTVFVSTIDVGSTYYDTPCTLLVILAISIRINVLFDKITFMALPAYIDFALIRRNCVFSISFPLPGNSNIPPPF